MTEIIYPPGCRPISEDLGPDELIRRLKTLAHTLQAMGQDDGAYKQYVPLSLHLAEDIFLNHPSRDVQLLIACCIADVLRVYAPEAPYQDPDQVKTIFLFLIAQLSGLKDPKDPAFKRYFYLLENLAYVKSFNMCFDLQDCQEIFCALFQLMFKIVNDEHSGRVKSFMLDVLCPLITESDMVGNDLLDIILMNIVEPNKTQHKNAYFLAKELVIKTSETLEPYIQAFFNQVLILGKADQNLQISSKVYDLIYELNHICPQILVSVLPQLECKLKSTHESERLAAVALLAKMFSEKESELPRRHGPLWRAFLGRFNDISVAIRTKCVQYSMHFLLNHPDLRKDITETLKMRQHDSDENVRFQVVMSIVTTARNDFQVVSDSEDLLEFVKERTLDKKFKIRKEAMAGLALIYKKHLSDPDVPNATKKAVTWIKDKILHGYYMAGMEDKLLVERLLNTCLVPYQLPAAERMKKLYHLLGTVDEHATKAFMELQKNQLCVRKLVLEWLDLHKKFTTTNSPDVQKDIAYKVTALSRCLPEPVKAHEFLTKFSNHLRKDPDLMEKFETVARPTVSCKECSEGTAAVLKKLGAPVMTNLYYNMVKMLLERISSVMIDHEALGILIRYVEDCLRGGNSIEEIGLHPTTAGERGLKLLVMLSVIFPSHFHHADILEDLMDLLRLDDVNVAPLVLTVFTFLGKYKCLYEQFPNLMNTLAPICKDFACTGTPKQAKGAIHCIHKNMPDLHDELFAQILEAVKENLNPESNHYRTAIVALGHIAFTFPEKYKVPIKNIVSRKIVKELLVKDIRESEEEEYSSMLDSAATWCPEDELPEDTRCKVEGLKAMARWLLGLKQDVASAQKTFRMLNAFILHKGDLLQSGKLSKAEMSWLRLAAGCAMLKVCEQKGVGDQYTAEQFYNLSQLMCDEVKQVREIFASKLHKGLNKGLPNKCLPLDFMGYYALAGRESDHRLRSLIRNYMLNDINRRRDYVKTITMGNTTAESRAMVQLPHILPDYMLVFAIPVLAHDPRLMRWDNLTELQAAQQCLWFVLEPLVTKNDYFSFGFYKTLIEKMKNHKDAVRPDDDHLNYKLWALCDLTTGLILTKASNYDMKDVPTDTRIPTMLFAPQKNFQNTRVFLPPELQYQPNKKMLTLSMLNNENREKVGRKSKYIKQEGCGPLGTDVQPSEASETKISVPGLEESSIQEEGPPAKRLRERIRNDEDK
ncbi:sister chromatid cohesion protein PDS5 homolog B [Anthonomus grandis grandis]|uniref:sister chromatid cohesion protein PDS5 homolog B n=1 Tax=Anthonomus grandis grandis TaxID=2921223 RepID=UPI002165BE37|nr:sister chromatid cohesion protein PDS5 homolog B [Anthonomus grandis grandis]XP_050315657.1 sister chromatid cohesion protein PDS5 homolog B [Anthonomus grandis grandis]